MTQATFPEVTPESAAHQLANLILAKRQDRLQARVNEKPWKPRRHYASNLNGCARTLVYAFTNYTEREPFSIDGIASMEDGNHEEKLLIRELMDDGFDVVEQQVGMDDDKHFVTGKIDGKIRHAGRRIPFEVKRISSYAFDKLEGIKDLYEDDFMLKKLRQLTLYLYLHNEEYGLFIFSDGVGGRKIIVVPLDYALAESILKDLETANVALKQIEAGTPAAEALPARIPYRSKVCGYCSFKKVCLPDMTFGPGAEVLGDEELKETVKTYLELKPQMSKFEKAKKAIKTTLEGKPLVVLGDYTISGEWKERTVKAQPERVDKYWSWDVESAGGA